ncbi:MAG: hypothetical protein ACK5KR_01740 [Breznakia sp.]
MKKKLLSCIAILLLASACGNATTQVTKEDKTLITVGDTKITKGNMYTMLSAQGSIAPIEKEMYKILVKKFLKENKETIAEAKENLATQKETYADKWESTLKSAGYKSEKAYYEDYLLNLNIARLTDLYIDKNFNDLIDKYQLRKVEIVAISDPQKTEAALKDAEEGVEFTKVATTYGDTTTYDGNVKVYNSKSELPEVVWKNILDVEKDGKLVKKVLQDTTTSTYYLVKVVNTKAKDFKEDAITSLKDITSDTSTQTPSSTASSELGIDDQAFAYFLKEADYSIHDVDIYQLLLTSSQKFARE